MGTIQRGLVVLIATALAVLVSAEHAEADGWSREDLGQRQRWRRPALDPADAKSRVRSAIDRLDAGTLTESQKSAIVDMVLREQSAQAFREQAKRAMGAAPAPAGFDEGKTTDQRADDALRAYAYAVLSGSTSADAGAGSLSLKSMSPEAANVTAASPEAQRLQRRILTLGASNLAKGALDESQSRNRTLLEQLRDAGLSLRRGGYGSVGFKDPAEISYLRDLKTKDEAFSVELGLTWRPPHRRHALVGGGKHNTRAMIAPVIWGAMHLTTAEPTAENFWGGGVAGELTLGYPSVCSDLCCNDYRLRITGGMNWYRSQDGDTEKTSGMLQFDPYVGPIALGFRKPIGGRYGEAPLSFNWNASAKLEYGHTSEIGDTRETSEWFVRGTFKATATLYLDQLGRWLRRDCTVEGDICNPDKARQHDPYFQAEYNGFWLADESEVIHWTRLSFVLPIPGDEGFTFSFVYENGAQAPVSFRDTETIGFKFGLRF